MTQQTPFYALNGGLDLITPAIAMKPGNVIAGKNYEPIFGGYRRLAGYERFDGRPSPTDVFDAEGDPAQAIIEREAARAAILEVPGSGDLRGVWSFDGEKYAFRDNAGGTACVMHKATSSGWVPIVAGRTLSFTSGGVASIEEGDTIVGATSGATAIVRRVVVQGAGTFGAGTAAGYLVVDTQTGTFVAESINVVAGQADIANIAGNSASITFPAGGRYEFINHNFYGASNLKRMYGVNGVGPAFEFDGANIVPIITGMPVDTPTRLAEHRQALFLAFPGGSVQFSQPGEPLLWSVVLGAGEIGIGDEVTDFIANTKTSLVILGQNSINVLYGSDSGEYQLETLTDESGAYPWTADKVGQAIYMDKGGLRSIAATQAYGNFALGTISRRIQPVIQSYVASGRLPVAAIRIRTKDQYRIFFNDMTGFAVHMGSKEAEILPLDLGKLITCICSVETDAGDEIYFGSDDGFVYQMDKGTSFDGEEITYFVRLPFWHLGAPQQLKRYHKVVLECDAAPATTLYLSADYNYGDPYEVGSPASAFTITGGGGEWDLSNWNEFYWSNPVEGLAEAFLDGVAKNMSLLIGGQSAEETPHTLQGITYFFTPRGLAR